MLVGFLDIIRLTFSSVQFIDGKTCYETYKDCKTFYLVYKKIFRTIRVKDVLYILGLKCMCFRLVYLFYV